MPLHGRPYGDAALLDTRLRHNALFNYVDSGRRETLSGNGSQDTL